jgi:membrane-bound metal-dependent hydrolase YbcI (DUF457 family)
MKSTGHVSTAILVAAPLIYFRSRFPEGWNGAEYSSYQLLWWTGLFAVLPDTDIVLRQWLPIKHRGFASHSLYTALLAGGALWAWWHYSVQGSVPALKFVSPLTAALAFLAVFVHLLGDAITITGVPLLFPNQKWHVPLIGGHAAFDNFFLNLIPVVLAGWLVTTLFGYNPEMLKGFGKFRDYEKVLIQKVFPESSPAGSPSREMLYRR